MRLFSLVFVIILFSSQLIIGQDLPYHFKRYSINEGLSNNSVNCVLQTSDGYLWIATKDGLNQFDGQSFKLYKHLHSDKNSLPENYVMSLLEDSQNNFWVGTWGGGLCRFDKSSESFEIINTSSDSANYIQVLIEDNNNNIWFGTTNAGLYSLNLKNRKVTSYYKWFKHNNILNGQNITALAFENDSVLWVGTEKAGIIRYNTESQMLRQYQNKPEDEKSINSNYIWSLQFDREYGLLAGTAVGLERFDAETESFLDFSNALSKKYPILNSIVRQTMRDRQNHLWIGLYEYLGLIRLNNGVTLDSRLFKRVDGNNNSLICDRIRCIYQDQRNNIWIGTEDGLNKLSYAQPFMQYRYFAHSNRGLGGRVVSSIFEGRNNKLWVGFGGAGFDEIDLQTNKIKHHRASRENPTGLSSNDVVTIYEDKQGLVWLGTSVAGLNSYNPKTGKYHHYKSDLSRLGYIRSNWIQQILETTKGEFLVGTNATLEVYDREKDVFIPFSTFIKSDKKILPDNLQTNALFEDSKGNIWIGTWLDGLFCYNVFEKRFYHYMPNPDDNSSISSSRISVIAEDKKGYIWIGTHSGGLNKFDPRTKVFKNFSTHDGLPNDVIFGIQEDNFGNLWLSTMNGLAKFNPENNSFRIYDENDGLIHNQFNWRASCKGNDGTLYFGGINGFIAFKPEDIRIDNVPPPIAINSFKVFDKEILPNQQREKYSSIELPYDQNFFTIEFAALDVAPKYKHQYAYILEGIDPHWMVSKTETKATYTDIRPGSYVFNIKASNADFVWSEPLQMAITVLPPWWHRWWFRLIVMVVIIAAVIAIYKYRIAVLLEIYRIRLNIAGDLHDEIGSSLSSISVETHMLLNNKNIPNEERNRLLDISATIKDTVDAMRDIVWFIHPGKRAETEIILKIRETTARLLDGLDWKIDIKPGVQIESYSLEVRRNIYLILKEALTNVARHAEASKCEITMSANALHSYFIVRDNGIGFDPEQTRGNIGILNMKRRTALIGGVFEIKSAARQGTMIKLKLPLKTKIISTVNKPKDIGYKDSNSFIMKINDNIKNIFGKN